MYIFSPKSMPTDAPSYVFPMDRGGLSSTMTMYYSPTGMRLTDKVLSYQPYGLLKVNLKRLLMPLTVRTFPPRE